MKKAEATLLGSKGRAGDEELEAEMVNNTFQKFSIWNKERNGGIFNGVMGLYKKIFCLFPSRRDPMYIFRPLTLGLFMPSWKVPLSP